MNKTEKSIMMGSYKAILTLIRIGFDKEDSRLEIKDMLIKLGLKEEITECENEFNLTNNL